VNNGTTPPSGHEVEEPIPEPHYTGKVMGQSEAGQEGMKIFNGCMVRVHLDRAKNGKKFNDLFMHRIKDRYEKKNAAANNTLGVEAAAFHEDRDDFILSDFNIESYMEWCKEYNHHGDSNNKDDESNSNAATSLNEVQNGRSTLMQSYSTSRNNIYLY
jgi:hypothetical protein